MFTEHIKTQHVQSQQKYEHSLCKEVYSIMIVQLHALFWNGSKEHRTVCGRVCGEQSDVSDSLMWCTTEWKISHSMASEYWCIKSFFKFISHYVHIQVVISSEQLKLCVCVYNNSVVTTGWALCHYLLVAEGQNLSMFWFLCTETWQRLTAMLVLLKATNKMSTIFPC